MATTRPTHAGELPLTAMDVQVFASGDHEIHFCDVDGVGIKAVWDNDSQVLNLYLHESDAKDLYFWLLTVIPRLQRDRR